MIIIVLSRLFYFFSFHLFVSDYWYDWFILWDVLNWEQLKGNTWRFIFMCLSSLSLWQMGIDLLNTVISVVAVVSVCVSVCLSGLCLRLRLYISVSIRLSVLPYNCTSMPLDGSIFYSIVSHWFDIMKIKTIGIVSIVHCSLFIFNLWNTQVVVSGGSRWW